MAKICEICGRGALTAASRSHSNIATKQTRFLNLQNTTINGKKVRACTRCIKTQSKVKK
ncbi:MAG: L28 family ribosomal protein [Patescibacteria group bacterium]|jgi:ribosomal protein L28